MSFWEDLQKSLTDAAAFTVQKTSELTGIAKLKYNIHAAEGKLERCYSEIGKLFYDTQKTGTEHTDEIATIIMQADKLTSDIESMKAESAKLRNTNVCENCSAEVSRDCIFCPVCGAKLPVCECECTCDEDGSCECECECEDECKCDCEDSAECTCDCEDSAECTCDCEDSAENTCECRCDEDTAE